MGGKVGSKYVYDTNEDINSIMDRQDELYMDESYNALSGEGLGIQLELDKQTDERFFPSQLFYNLATNITTDTEKKILSEMLAARKRVMEANSKARN